MAAAAAAYTPSRSSRASSLAAGIVPAFAARVSSSLASKRNNDDREMGSGRSSLVAVGRRTSSRGRRINDRGVSTAVSMSFEGWKIQPRALGLPGGVFSRAGGWPPAVGDRYDVQVSSRVRWVSIPSYSPERAAKPRLAVGQGWVGSSPPQPFLARILTPIHEKRVKTYQVYIAVFFWYVWGANVVKAPHHARLVRLMSTATFRGTITTTSASFAPFSIQSRGDRVRGTVEDPVVAFLAASGVFSSLFGARMLR